MRIAMLQAAPSISVGINVGRLAAALEQAGAQNADLVVTPEMFLTGYNIGAQACRANAQTFDGPVLTTICELVSEAGVALVLGFPELGADQNVYNSAALIDSTGTPRAIYRKTHLFGELDRAQFTAGNTFAEPVDIADMRVGLGICYDIEFGEFARALALAGADVIAVPTANWLESVNNRLVPVRAQENSIAVVYVNYDGVEGDLAYCGQSIAAGPDGEILATAEAGDSLTFVDLSPNASADIRSRIDYLADRRPDLY